MFNTRVAVLTAPLFLIHAQAIHYFQEGRTYSLAMLCAVASTLAFCWAMEDRASTRRWFVYGLVAGVASYGHLFVWFVLAGHALAVMVRRAWPARRAVTAGAVPLVVAALPLVIFTTRGYDNISWVRSTTTGAVRVALTRTVFGGTAVLWLVPFFVLWIWRWWRARHDERDLFAVTLVACWFAAPFVLAVVVSLWKPLFVTRYFIVCVPAAALLTAAGLDALAKRSRGIAAAGLALLLLVNGALLRDWYRGQTANEDFRSAVAVACNEAGDDGLVVFKPDDASVAKYYETSPCGVAASTTRLVYVVRNVAAKAPGFDGWTTIRQHEFTDVTVYVLTKR